MSRYCAALTCGWLCTTAKGPSDVRGCSHHQPGLSQPRNLRGSSPQTIIRLPVIHRRDRAEKAFHSKGYHVPSQQGFLRNLRALYPSAKSLLPSRYRAATEFLQQQDTTIMDLPANLLNCNPVEHPCGQLGPVNSGKYNLIVDWVRCARPCWINSLDPYKTPSTLSGQHVSGYQWPLSESDEGIVNRESTIHDANTPSTSCKTMSIIGRLSYNENKHYILYYFSPFVLSKHNFTKTEMTIHFITKHYILLKFPSDNIFHWLIFVQRMTKISGVTMFSIVYFVAHGCESPSRSLQVTVICRRQQKKVSSSWSFTRS